MSVQNYEAPLNKLRRKYHRHLVDIIFCLWLPVPAARKYSNMARKLSVDKELDDMTECSICTEVFTDPRVLPCIHTFCLKCLLNYGKDRQPGDHMPCPLCRKEFTIPDGWLSGIRGCRRTSSWRNYF